MLARHRQGDGSLKDVAIRFTYQAGAGVQVSVSDPPTEPLAPLDEYTQKVQRSAARGTVYPYEIVPLLTGPNGTFTEYDFNDANELRAREPRARAEQGRRRRRCGHHADRAATRRA